MDKCTDRLKNDIDSYTQDQYQQMENELAEKINQLIIETENKYCVAALIDPIVSKTRVSVFIINKSQHNNPIEYFKNLEKTKG